MSYASESSDREPDSDESNIQKANRDLAFVTFNRMQEREALFEKVHACSLKVKVLFGEDAYNPFVEVRRCFGEVRVGARMLYRTPYGGYNDQSFVEKMEKRIWDHESDEPDSIEFKVRSAVKSIEERLSKELQMA